jgi:thiamine biosynthesis protein ThiS
MVLIVNGKPTETAPGTTIRQLLATLGLKPERVAIELNRRLVRAPDYDRILQDNDALEVVTFVGGG